MGAFLWSLGIVHVGAVVAWLVYWRAGRAPKQTKPQADVPRAGSFDPNAGGAGGFGSLITNITGASAASRADYMGSMAQAYEADRSYMQNRAQQSDGDRLRAALDASALAFHLAHRSQQKRPKSLFEEMTGIAGLF